MQRRAAQHAARACSAARATLLSGCGRWRDSRGLVCVRSAQDSGSAGTGRITVADPPGRPQLGDLLEEVVVDVEEERQARREVVDVEPALDPRCTCRSRRPG